MAQTRICLLYHKQMIYGPHVKNRWNHHGETTILGMQSSSISPSQFSAGLRLYQSHGDISLVTISSSVSRLINAEEMRGCERERCDSKKNVQLPHCQVSQECRWAIRYGAWPQPRLKIWWESSIADYAVKSTMNPQEHSPMRLPCDICTDRMEAGNSFYHRATE